MALIEPILILAVGIAIVLLVVVFILPLFSAYGSLI
jgi:type II secretory pathway component PulF